MSKSFRVEIQVGRQVVHTVYVDAPGPSAARTAALQSLAAVAVQLTPAELRAAALDGREFIPARPDVATQVLE
jgi:hypothetical protein